MKKIGLLMAVALIGLALFGAAPAAADDEVDDAEEGPVEVQPVVDDGDTLTEPADDDTGGAAVGFEDSGVNTTEQGVPAAGGAEVIVAGGADTDSAGVAVDDVGAGGDAVGTSFGAGVGAGAAAGCTDAGTPFAAAGAGVGAGAGGTGTGTGTGVFLPVEGTGACSAAP